MDYSRNGTDLAGHRVRGREHPSVGQLHFAADGFGAGVILG